MSIQLQPLQNFAIVRQLPDPYDSNTYYVQAVVRNAQTDALIDTVNLTDKGQRRFIGLWRAVADKSGQGTLVSIRTTVYTDSGYTTKSQNYNEEMETYLVMERFNPNEVTRQLGASIGGDDVDYKKIRKIVVEELEKKLESLRNAIEAIKIPTKEEFGVKDYDTQFADLKDTLSVVAEDIKTSFPEGKEESEINFAPVADILDQEFEGLKATLSQITEAISANKPEPVELAPVTEALERLEKREQVPEEVISKLDEAFSKISSMFEEKYPKMLEATNSLLDKIRDAFLYSVAGGGKKEKGEVEEPFMKRAGELASRIKYDQTKI